MMDRWGAPNPVAQYHTHATAAAHHYQQLVAEQHASHATQLQQLSSQQVAVPTKNVLHFFFVIH